MSNVRIRSVGTGYSFFEFICDYNMDVPDVKIISPETINKIIGIDHKNKKFSVYPGKEGLSKDEILAVLEQHKLTITWSDFFENPNIEYNDYVYRSVNHTPIDKWSERILTSDPARRPIVVRTLLTEKEAYLKGLCQRDFDGNEFTEQNKRDLLGGLPERFWLSEISLPDLYTTNKTKIVDFFYKPDCPVLDNNDKIFERWLQVRFPYALLKRNADSSASMIPMAVKSHYPLLRLGREHDILDW